MARQLGYTDAQLEAIRDPARAEGFTEAERAALLLAEKMAADAHAVTDDDFALLRCHYSEPEIVELACAIGLTCYFNRLTTAFRIDLSGTNRPYEEGPI